MSGELVEIDIKYASRQVKNRYYYHFTAIDCASCWSYLKIYDDMDNNLITAFVNKFKHFFKCYLIV